MEAYFTLRDRRLAGGVTNAPGLYIENTDGNTSLLTAFSRISRAAEVSGTLEALFILCHGYMDSGEDPVKNQSYEIGGGGLELGKEGLNLSNVHLWSQIKGKTKSIIVYACGAADTAPGKEGTNFDGRYLMGSLALYTNANVFAADRTQFYGRAKDMHNGLYNFGAWEGTLYQFPSDGGPSTSVSGAPYEFSWIADYLRRVSKL